MRLLAVLGFLLASILPAAAFDTAEELVAALYAPYMGGAESADVRALRSDELNLLYDAEAARVAEGEDASLDFDPFVNGQDFQVTDLVTELTPDSNEFAATINVSFKNFGQPVSLQLQAFNFDSSGWKLEDITSTMPGAEYRLTDLLSPKIIIGDDVFADPSEVVEALYDAYSSERAAEWRRWDAEQLYSTQLKALFLKDQEEAGGEIGRIDFDPWINGQDYEIKDVVIGDPVIAGDRATVPVEFKNFDQPQKATLTLVKEGARWMVDDIENVDTEYAFRLRAILEAPMP